MMAEYATYRLARLEQSGKDVAVVNYGEDGRRYQRMLDADDWILRDPEALTGFMRCVAARESHD